jgi:hypothetical protein
VRPIFNERSIVLLNELALDVSYDRIMTHKELAMDGNRFEQAAARGAALPLSASELARCFGDLWPSADAASKDLQRSDIWDISQIELLFGKCPTYRHARYKRGNQKRPTPALVRSDAPNPRAALESVVGPVDWFEFEQVAEPAAEAQAEPAAEAEPVNTPVSQIDANPADPAGRVVQFPPSAVKELHWLQRIVSTAGRLADLSGRLERARPPPDLSRRVERVAVLQ